MTPEQYWRSQALRDMALTITGTGSCKEWLRSALQIQADIESGDKCCRCFGWLTTDRFSCICTAQRGDE